MKMKVAISTIGRFHLFNLAQQLNRRGYLSQLITSYPWFEVKKYGLDKRYIGSVIEKEIIQRSWENLPFFLRKLYKPDYFIHRIFDRKSRKLLRPANILVAGPAAYPGTMKKAKEQGAMVIVENGSSHAVFREDIVLEEYERFGLKERGIRLLTDKRLVNDTIAAYEEMDYISVPSYFAKKTFLEKGIAEEKIIHIPYGVDLSEFYNTGKKDDIFRIVFAGGLSLQKGVHYLLRAFSELNLPKAELVLAGTKNDEIDGFLKKYSKNVRVLGHIKQNKLREIYSESSVFVLPSIQDGFGLVIMQAMACGLPVIATTNTGGPDIIKEGENGFVISIRDVEALKSKLMYLYDNREQAINMGQRAEKTVKTGFTWHDYGDRIEKSYKKIMKIEG